LQQTVCFDTVEDVRCKDAPSGKILSQTTWCAGDPSAGQTPPPAPPPDQPTAPQDEEPAEGMDKMYPLVGAGYRTQFCGEPPEGWKVGETQMFGGLHWGVGIVSIVLLCSCVAAFATGSLLKIMQKMFNSNYGGGDEKEKPEEDTEDIPSKPSKTAFK
jgi:hypothetical protein